jgi:putative ABC transport system permease protein
MNRVLSIAAKNLMRYHRRTLLTSLLIMIGTVAVLLFIALSGSFRELMVGQITDSMLGHIQIHKKGYVASIDSLPLTRNMSQRMVDKVQQTLAQIDQVESWSPRIKFGAMFSNYAETTNIRINAVLPEREQKTVPLLSGRILEGDTSGALVERGKVLIPEIIAKGMKVNVGDTIVIVANNRDGSVNGANFTVQGILEGISGPGGRDGYMHIEDARDLLRMEEPEVSEIAVRLKDPKQIESVYKQLQNTLGSITNQQGKPAFEIHTWEKLSPFSNIAQMIDLLDVFIKVMLVSIVLISIMNVMLMAVYERIREIGTLSAIGTTPNKILALFVTEGFLLGTLGTAIGVAISLITIYVLNVKTLTFSFGRQENLVLSPTIAPSDVAMIAVVVLAVAVLASLQPAWKAANMDPIDALRHV